VITRIISRVQSAQRHCKEPGSAFVDFKARGVLIKAGSKGWVMRRRQRIDCDLKIPCQLATADCTWFLVPPYAKRQLDFNICKEMGLKLDSEH